MKSGSMLILALASGLAFPLVGQPPTLEAPHRLTLSVRDADLKDILRAATEGTDLNLIFDPNLDTRVKGLDLKSVTLQELLDQVLPSLGVSYVLKGRTLYISKADGGLKFYQVDYLSMRRSGKKEFMVNASGQTIQTTGAGGQSGGGSGGGQGGQNSAYTSSLQTENGFDPWRELQIGLTTLIFGKPMGGEAASSDGAAPGAKAYALDGKTLIIQPDSGLVVVGADPSTQQRVGDYLRELKRRNSRQVQLEARIVEVTLNKDSQIGVDWNKAFMSNGTNAGLGGTGTTIGATFATGSTTNPNVTSNNGLFQLVVDNLRVNATLSALAAEGRLTVLSAPRLSTLNNQKAILRVVREDAYFLQNSQITPSSFGPPIVTTTITPLIVPVGIVLDIQPEIGEDGTITLSVNPSVSQVVSVQSITSGNSISGGASATLPVVDRRDLDTVVRLRSGETLVLAGIIQATDNDDNRGVPWLSKIPFLGALFDKREKSRSHTELAIFITPTLVDDSEQMAAQRKTSEDRLEKAGAVLHPDPPKNSIKNP